MVAQIYQKRMEASRSQSEMEDNRQRAYKVAQDVCGAGYPAGWGVGDAARKLMNELTDARRCALASNQVAKNETGGVAPNVLAVARAQSAAMQASANAVRQRQVSGLAARVAAYVPPAAGYAQRPPAQAGLSSIPAGAKAAYAQATSTGRAPNGLLNVSYSGYARGAAPAPAASAPAKGLLIKGGTAQPAAAERGLHPACIVIRRWGVGRLRRRIPTGRADQIPLTSGRSLPSRLPPMRHWHSTAVTTPSCPTAYAVPASSTATAPMT